MDTTLMSVKPQRQEFELIRASILISLAVCCAATTFLCDCAVRARRGAEGENIHRLDVLHAAFDSLLLSEKVPPALAKAFAMAVPESELQGSKENGPPEDWPGSLVYCYAIRPVRLGNDSTDSGWVCYFVGDYGFVTVVQEGESRATAIWSKDSLVSVFYPSTQSVELTGVPPAEILITGSSGAGPSECGEIVTLDGGTPRLISPYEIVEGIRGNRLCFSDLRIVDTNGDGVMELDVYEIQSGYDRLHGVEPRLEGVVKYNPASGMMVFLEPPPPETKK